MSDCEDILGISPNSSVATVQYTKLRYRKQCTVVQNSTEQYNIVKYSTSHYRTVQSSKVQYGTVRYSTVKYNISMYSLLLQWTIILDLLDLIGSL